MSYTPTEWKKGDVVTSAKLNNIEQGIVANDIFGDAFVVHASIDMGTGTITVQESAEDIQAAVAAERSLMMLAGGVMMNMSSQTPTQAFFQGMTLQNVGDDDMTFAVTHLSLTFATAEVAMIGADFCTVAATVTPIGG